MRVYPECRKGGHYIIYAIVIPTLNGTGQYYRYIGQTDRFDERQYEHQRDCRHARDETMSNNCKYRNSKLYNMIHTYGGWNAFLHCGGHFEIIDKTNDENEAVELENKYMSAVPKHLSLNTLKSTLPTRKKIIEKNQTIITQWFKYGSTHIH